MKKETSAAVKKAATQEKAENKLDYERIRTFVKSYIKEDSEKLEEIYSSAVEREVPVIREDTRDYLRLLLNQVKPVKVYRFISDNKYSPCRLFTVHSRYSSFIPKHTFNIHMIPPTNDDIFSDLNTAKASFR